MAVKFEILSLYLAALYLGTGDTSKSLVEAVQKSLHSTGGQTRTHFLLDYCRGNRNVEGQSSCTMLQPLLQGYAVIYYCTFKHISEIL